MVKQIVLLFMCLALIGGLACKKYPEGPILSLETKMRRIAGKISKSWQVDYFSIDGCDSTSYLKGQPLFGKYNFEHTDKNGRAGFFYSSNNGTYGTSGTWNLVNDKNDIQIYSQSYVQSLHFNLGPFAADDERWEIRRLTEKDLWLKCSYNSKEYFIKFRH